MTPLSAPIQKRSAVLRRARLRRNAPGYAMLLPFVGLFIGFLVWPLANSLYLAFTNFRGTGAPFGLVGFENFRRLWFEDERFRHALSNTFTYVVSAVVIGTLLSLAIALAFRGTSWRDRIMRTIFFLPSVTNAVALFIIWRWIFSPEEFGLANTVSSWFGLHSRAWTGTPELTIPILVLIAVWGGCGYGMVIFVAGLNAIPDEYYEQAKIDGAGTWHQFRHITLPLLRPVTTYVVITGLISSFQVFEAVYVIYFQNAGTIGGVLDSGLMIVPYLYDIGFGRFQLGMASAIAWTLFLIIFVISLIQLRVSRTLKDW
jgi:multiple sugar transport system permease protein